MTDKQGWLIEHNEYQSGHRWLRAVVDGNGDHPSTVRLIFTTDSLLAFRFARREDADAFIYLHPEVTLNCRAIEHGWGLGETK